MQQSNHLSKRNAHEGGARQRETGAQPGPRSVQCDKTLFQIKFLKVGRIFRFAGSFIRVKRTNSCQSHQNVTLGTTDEKSAPPTPSGPKQPEIPGYSAFQKVMFSGDRSPKIPR